MLQPLRSHKDDNDGLQSQAESAAAGAAPEEALRMLGFDVGNAVWKNIGWMKQYLLIFLFIPWLFACDGLTDNEVKALKCELWRDSGSVLNRQIYRDLTGKSKCITTKDFGEMLAIKGSKGIAMPCDPKEQESFLQEVNSMCDSLLNKKISD